MYPPRPLGGRLSVTSSHSSPPPLLFLSLLLAICFSLITSTTAQFTPPATCNTDLDCLSSVPEKSSDRRAGEWGCLASQCVFLVQGGELCTAAAQCAGFHRLQTGNATLPAPEDYCAPRFCTLQSTCDPAWSDSNGPGAISVPSVNYSCCGGDQVGETCAVINGVLDTCEEQSSCDIDGGFICKDVNAHSHVWIGVVLVLIGATTLNLGLNLQKLAYRRWEAAKATAAQAALQNPPPPPAVEVPTSEMTRRKRWQGYGKKILLGLRFWKNIPVSSKTWWAGLVVFIVGNVLNFVALQFAPQSLVAPLGSMSLVTNVLLAPLINKERLGKWDIIGVGLIVIGSVLVVIFSGQVMEDFKLCVLLNLFRRPQTIAYLCAIGVCVVSLYLFIRFVEARILPTPPPHEDIVLDVAEGPSTGLPPSHPDSASGVIPVDRPKSDGSTATTIVDKPKATNVDGDGNVAAVLSSGSVEDTREERRSESPYPAKEVHSDFIGGDGDGDSERTRPEWTGGARNISSGTSHLPLSPGGPGSMEGGKGGGRLHRRWHFGGFRRRDDSRPATRSGFAHDGKFTQYLLPLAYACLGGFMSSLTTLFAKSLINLLTESVVHQNNQFNNGLAWVILIVTVVTAVSQVYWINMGLQRYDALLQVPVFYCCYNILDIIGGAVYYNEFQNYTALKYVMFILGVLFIITGVGSLAKRLKRLG